MVATFDDWGDVRRWRVQQRKRLVAERLSLPAGRRRQIGAAIAANLAHMPAVTTAECVAFYWPMHGEPDLRPFVLALCARGVAAALPVVVEPGRPLEFWRWDADMRMRRQAVWNIPVPADRDAVSPQVLLIPLIGFDRQCHRLGHGGGYYDRTLAVLEPRPFAVGVGLAQSELETIHPQPHDVALDAIVTERKALRRDTGP